MENVERIYELLEEIGNCYLTSLLPSITNQSLLEILEEDIIYDLQRLLEKVKFYSQKAKEN